ncbi:ROK family protein [Galbitalea sp. SE-J8]|uniref:ROK family protein n=1 Tax=Galbitalea sp. SE-J8 TaxID=3054952 RepID=UPI00259CDD86|nr:ROK family protein [Galbitalea sp. SE-J8]MDM4762625.1 ROK family protein [Galbitalea sp. SE-J8]
MTPPIIADPTALALGVDLGGTKVEAALVDPDGVVVPGTRFRAPTGRASSSEQLAASVREVVGGALAALPAGSVLLGVGIGSAGPIAVDRGLVSPLNLPSWRDYPLRDLVLSIVPDGTPVTLRMDGQCIALAEHWVGAGQGVDNLMGMIVSTGIGGGLILGGVVVPGPTGNAGHIGHVEVGGFDDVCDCGGIGCVEGIASGPKTVAWARRRGFTGATGEELAAAYAAGDPIAAAAVERAGRAIGQSIASATALVDLDVIAIGGGFSHVTPDIFEHINRAIAGRVQFGFVTKARAVPSALSGEGPLIGAAALIHRAEHVG